MRYLQSRGVANGVSTRVLNALADGGVTFYNFMPSNFKNIRKGAANVRRGAANSNLILIGGSSTAGQTTGASAGTQRLNAYGVQLAGQLTTAGLTSGWNNLWGDGSLGTNGDNRFTLSGGMALSLGGIGNVFQATSSGTLAFTPTVEVDTFVVYYYDNGTGRFSDQVDSGSVNSPAASGSAGHKTRTVSTTLGAHTLNLAWVSGAVYIFGIDAYDSSVKQLSIWNCGVSGYKTSDYLQTTFNISSGSLLNNIIPECDGAIISLGSNDGISGVSLSTFRTNMVSLLELAIDNDCDPIIMTQVPNNATYPSKQQTDYNEVLDEIAIEYELPMIDLYERWESYSSASAIGFLSDSTHPNALGYSDIASVVRSALLTVV